MNILELLSDKHVLDVYVNKEMKTAIFTEACDYHFEVELNGEQIGLLAQELLGIANELMKGEHWNVEPQEKEV